MDWHRHRRTGLVGAALLLGAALAQAQDAGTPEQLKAAKEWPTYGHDSGGMRFSPLTQINPANVAALGVAWVYHLKPEGYVAPAGGRRGPPPGAPPGEGPPPGFGGGRGPATGFQASEATPVVVDGILYLPSPYGRVVALDAVTGKEVWIYKLPSGNPAMRGVEYFPGDGAIPAQIVVGTSDAKLFTLDAKTGALNGKFGIVDLNTPQITRGVANASVPLSSPPVMYKNLIILGGRNPEGSGPGPAGDVRAYDIHDGHLAWTFHSIPLAGEPNAGSWAPGSTDKRAGVNVWGLMTVDARRGIAYLPFGAPSGDLFGGDRPGNNLYDSSIVAVDAASGKYLWHFQVVHHDIWDFDLESPPVLMDVKRDGRTIPAVAVFGKSSLLFLLDRVTGKPIYGVEERAVAQTKVPGEKTSPTQPFPLKPGPLARIDFTMADIATVTPELEAACRKLIADNAIEVGLGPYAPPSYNHLRVIFPSEIGGADWGGGSFNPQLGYLFINVNDLGQLNGLKDPASGPLDLATLVGNKAGGRTGPYANLNPQGRFKVTDPALNMPCNQPPWGEMVAVNVNSGEIAWKVPLGVSDNLPAGKQNTGLPSQGGSIATASGLVFIGAATDNRFRALDAKTGKELWTVKLDASAESVPATYQGKDGKQYVAVVATGGGDAAAPVTSDAVTVFALK